MMIKANTKHPMVVKLITMPLMTETKGKYCHPSRWIRPWMSVPMIWNKIKLPGHLYHNGDNWNYVLLYIRLQEFY